MSVQQAHIPALDLQAEANMLQRAATRPDTPIWVGASAGSGKTRVLVNRLLRLMLPLDGRPGAEPSQILCITFTKAGASEVMDRVVKILRQWAIDTADDLKAALKTLLEATPDTAQIDRARSLFARVIEAPGGMKIMTIHAFCQSVLARFPMEAGLAPGFEVMVESEAKTLMRDVRRAIIMRLAQKRPEDNALAQAFTIISTLRNAAQIESLMENMMAERGRLRALSQHHHGIDGLAAAIDKHLGIAANITRSDILASFIEKFPEADMRLLAQQLGTDNTTNQKKAAAIATFIAQENHADTLDDYKSAFLTQKNTIAVANGILTKDDALLAAYTQEAERFLKLDATLRNVDTAQATKSLLRFSMAVLTEYEAEKRRRNRLDFEDLIDRTKRLLANGGVNWVQYKLDGGINHILVDEAQDTNPDQWDIITALYDEFYEGAGAREDMVRTTFVVGDEKQSIFSFQRADPRVFDQMRNRLMAKTAPMEKPLQTIPMRISFRSSPSILELVDTVFEPAQMRAGVLQNPAEPMHHDARFSGKAGYVELWPCIEKPAKTERSAWDLPRAAASTESPVSQMAQRVAQSIGNLLNDKNQILESEGRRITPGDIMILVSKRKPLAEALLKALREADIPVSGIDRMVVSRQLAVQDCLAAIAFALQPDDDLNLAALLKSPFLGFDEQALFDAAHNRAYRPLWQVIKETQSPAASWLSGLLAIEGGSVSAFLHRLFYRPCPMDTHSGMRALRARLGDDVRDPLQELLARADSFDAGDSRGLQGFLQDALNDDSQIKRDLMESDNRVRLMTVHGSKGLEAPIVFLPDTIRATAARNLKDIVLWPDRTDPAGIPLWAASGDTAADAYRQRMEDAKTRGDEEQRRLLYVALTRAAERLYIGGMQKSESRYIDKTNSWYFTCRTAMEKIGAAEGENLIFKNAQTDPVKPHQEKSHATIRQAALEDWYFQPAPATETPPRPLMPSRPEQDDPSVMSPLFGDLSHRYLRGRIIHTLFQFLPDLPPTERRTRAKTWLKQPAHNLDAKAQAEIMEAVFNVLEDPAFAPLFIPGGQAEVPLTGLLSDTRIVSGQIDRLLVKDGVVTVIDYKTNRPAPHNQADVPEAYRRQLRTYRDLLVRIYKDYQVRSVLLWTDGPRLMDMSDAL